MKTATRKRTEHAPQLTGHTRRVRLAGTTVSAALERATHALAQEGLTILAVIDVREALERRIERDIGPYWFLEVCHPVLAARALAVEHEGGLLSCRRIAIWQEGSDAVVAAIEREGAPGPAETVDAHVGSALSHLAG